MLTTCQLSVFSAPARYRAVKIVRSSFEMVLRTIKHIVIYPGSGPSLEHVLQGASRELEKFAWLRGKWILYPLLEG
jgi:hypothetical protein